MNEETIPLHPLHKRALEARARDKAEFAPIKARQLAKARKDDAVKAAERQAEYEARGFGAVPKMRRRRGKSTLKGLAPKKAYNKAHAEASKHPDFAAILLNPKVYEAYVWLLKHPAPEGKRDSWHLTTAFYKGYANPKSSSLYIARQLEKAGLWFRGPRASYVIPAITPHYIPDFDAAEADAVKKNIPLSLILMGRRRVVREEDHRNFAAGNPDGDRLTKAYVEYRTKYEPDYLPSKRDKESLCEAAVRLREAKVETHLWRDYLPWFEEALRRHHAGGRANPHGLKGLYIDRFVEQLGPREPVDYAWAAREVVSVMYRKGVMDDVPKEDRQELENEVHFLAAEVFCKQEKSRDDNDDILLLAKDAIEDVWSRMRAGYGYPNAYWIDQVTKRQELPDPGRSMTWKIEDWRKEKLRDGSRRGASLDEQMDRFGGTVHDYFAEPGKPILYQLGYDL